MAKILVLGSLDLSEQPKQIFISHLGEEIAAQGHHLLNGCRNDLDREIAKSSAHFLRQRGQEPGAFITCYVSANSRPAHEFGTILRSRCTNWESLASPGLDIPETVQQADVVILVGGTEGTKCAANWARINHKPLMPITTFGGAAADVYDEELRNFDAKYADRIDQSDYEILNQVSSDLRKIAKDTVALAARTITPDRVFVAMSFSDEAKLQDAYESFQMVCGEFHYKCKLMNEINVMERIVPEIFINIKKSAFVIVDLSEAKPNVYYELGFAQGLLKPVIVTACKGTALPFDVADIPTIFWEGQKQLKDRLREKIAVIATRQGRR
jgi:hypothetical protein